MDDIDPTFLNHDLIQQGLPPGSDDDLGADAETLFGSSVALMNLEVEACADGASVAAPSSSMGTSIRMKHNKFKVQNDHYTNTKLAIDASW